MCDTQPEYKHGDIVWVKLGFCWWPGEVIGIEHLLDSVKEEVQTPTSRLPTIAIVKFFQEDSYEYVKKHDKIFPYNCSKKDEFIKKGMDIAKTKKTMMANFPQDVITAEQRTDGNEKILEDEKFTKPKVSMKQEIAGLFGTPKPVKSSPKTVGRQKAGTKGTPGKKSTLVTHPRFLGRNNDHQRIVLVQQKKEDGKENLYKCPICNFTCQRVEAVALHHKIHLKTDPLFNDAKKKGKKGKRGPRKNKIPSSQTNSIDEDLALLEKGITLSDDDAAEIVPEKKKKRKRKRQSEPNQEDPNNSKKITPNITNDLLAEWDDVDEDEEMEDEVAGENESGTVDDTSLDQNVEVTTPLKESKVSKAKTPKQNLKANKEKQSKTKGDKSPAKDVEVDFDALLETTKVPDLPDLPKTSKSDDVKVSPKSPEIATKLTNPKKRFVKSFEDFELSMREKELEKEKDGFGKSDKGEYEDDDSEPQKEQIIEVLPSEESKSEEAIVDSEPEKEKIEVKKSPRRSTRFDKEKTEEIPKIKEVVEDKKMEEVDKKEEEVEKKKEEAEKKNQEVEKKQTRRSSARSDKDKSDEKKITETPPSDLEKKIDLPEIKTDLIEEKKQTRRSSARIESENLTQIEQSVESSDKKDESDEKKKPRRMSERTTEKAKVEESTKPPEIRKSGRRGNFASPSKEVILQEEKKIDETKTITKTKKEDSSKESESDHSDDPSKSKTTKKEKEDAKKTKDEEIKDSSSDKSKEKKDNKKDDKVVKNEEKILKKDDKPAATPEVNKYAKKESATEKSDKKFEQKEKHKPKEKIITEIDIFGSLREQENEKLKEKRETRASRSKSHSESSQEKPEKKSTESPKPSGKRAKKDDASVNNGKSEVDMSSAPLISKMKNKLMNMLNTEVDNKLKSTSTRGSIENTETEAKKTEEKVIAKTRRQSHALEDLESKKSTSEPAKLDSKRKAASLKDEEKKDIVKSPEPTRRHSLRNLPIEKDVSSLKADTKKVIYSSAEDTLTKLDEKKLASLKSIPTKAEIKAASPSKTEAKTSGPKTYLRASRVEKPESKSPGASVSVPNKAEIKPIEGSKTTDEKSIGVESTPMDVEVPYVEPTSSEEDTTEITEDKTPESTSKNINSSQNVKAPLNVDWIQTLSPHKKKIGPSDGENSQEKDKTALKVQSPEKESKVEEETLPDAPQKVQSPIKPASPVKAPTSPLKTPASPVKAPSSPIKTPTSPVKAPTSPIKSPLSPVKASATKSTTYPPSPSKTSPAAASSPTKPIVVTKQMSPLKSPPIILNKDAPKFDQPKKIAKRDEDVTKSTAKSPRRISLSTQEVSIEKVTDKVEVTVNNNDNTDSEVASKSVDESKDPLALLALVSTQNKDVIEKNITVVPEDILAEGQVEIAKIIEDGTEKIASIPHVALEKSDKSEVDNLQAQMNAESAISESAKPKVNTSTPKSPIILNSRAAEQESTSKLLDILTDNKRTIRPTIPKAQQVPLPKIATPKFDIEPKKPTLTTTKQAGRILTTASSSASPSTSKTKPTILSDTLIRPADSVVSVQKVKRTYDDIEDIDAFIITKHAKKSPDEETKKVQIMKSKPKILEHTIITAAGQVIQPITKTKKQPIIQQQTIKVASGSTKTVEEKVYDLLNSPKGKEDDAFDIDNMPIVLGDQLLTSDDIETMPVVISEQGKQTQVIKKPVQQFKVAQKQQVVTSPGTMKTVGTPTKTYTKIVKGQRVYQTTTSTVLKHQPTILATGKQGKFVIVPSQSSTPTGSKYTVGKRPLGKKQPAILSTKPTQNVAVSEPTGNKIMIVTNNQGHQQRVLLTPEQQKMMGYQGTFKKTIVKSPAMKTASGSSGLIAIKKPKVENKPQPQQKVGQKFTLPQMKSSPGQTRTVIIKNQLGQIVNRIHGTSDEDIEKQVAEQLEAINRAASAKTKGMPTVKRMIKKTIPASTTAEGTRTVTQNKVISSPSSTASATRTSVPPLAPISPTKKTVPEQQTPTKQIVRQQKPTPTPTTSKPTMVAKTETPTKPVEKPTTKEDRPPKQLVIQDSMGNETTITEGQILALPSETVDGQPQSYMLVTLDESGSLTPLNNEALMSLDPNLNLGGDLSNMVLQIEGAGAGAGTETIAASVSSPNVLMPESKLTPEVAQPTELLQEKQETLIPEQVDMQLEQAVPQVPAENVQELEAATEQMQAITCSINKGDTQQQLIITGDPVATQKFLESLTEGNPEIANVLAQVEGNNILIHTDGQQILINSDADNQMLMLNQEPDASLETGTNSIFQSQATTKNQDILAAALADTDVFQQEQSIGAAKITQSQLSPGYPIGATNVLETTTVNSPIMTPVEAPPNTKKIDTDVLTQVSKNVDLPITITDPNIAQSVSNQQVALMATEILASKMELPLTIQDVPTTSACMNSPSFYSLPSLDDGEKFTSPISMPLLTEDPEEVQATTNPMQKETSSSECDASTSSQELSSDKSSQESTAEYLLATGDMCTMSNQMSSLSEPPPDMFDFPLEQGYENKQDESQFCHASEEVPLQSAIDVSNMLVSKSPKRAMDANIADDSNKRAKLD